MKYIKRIRYAFSFFMYALRKPDAFNINHLKLVNDMAEFLKTTAEKNHPMRCSWSFKKVASVVVDHKPKEDRVTVLHVWCGVDAIDSPFERINQLIKENQMLKERVVSDLSNRITER